jgi:hypothetical protein
MCVEASRGKTTHNKISEGNVFNLILGDATTDKAQFSPRRVPKCLLQTQ